MSDDTDDFFLEFMDFLDIMVGGTANDGGAVC